jgi:hypothetical protein
MIRKDNPLDRGALYETRPWTWIVGAGAGVILSFGLLVAGDRYVRVATGAATETVASKPQRSEKVSVVQHR